MEKKEREVKKDNKEQDKKVSEDRILALQQELETKNQELEKKNKQYSELWDKYLRLYAEFDNARKRWEREKEEIIKLANFSLIKELIRVLDEIEQAMNILKEKIDEKIYKGLEMMYSNFFNILKKKGLRKIETKDKYFDPHLHEIASTKELEIDSDKPKIIEEIQAGYILEDKVIRPAKVVVGIKKSDHC
jgi:molecular chaperone GrpE